MPTILPSFSIFTEEYVRSLVRVFRRICPAMGLAEVVRSALVWHSHPLDARFNAAFAVVFLTAAVGLWWGRRPLLVIRLGFLAAVVLALGFDLSPMRCCRPASRPSTRPTP